MSSKSCFSASDIRKEGEGGKEGKEWGRGEREGDEKVKSDHMAILLRGLVRSESFDVPRVVTYM